MNSNVSARLASFVALLISLPIFAQSDPNVQMLQVVGTTRATWFNKDGSTQEVDEGSFEMRMDERYLRIKVVDPHGSAPRTIFLASDWSQTYAALFIGASKDSPPAQTPKFAPAVFRDEKIPSQRVRWEIIQRLTLVAHLLHEPNQNIRAGSLVPSIIPDFLTNKRSILGEIKVKNDYARLHTQVKLEGNQLSNIKFWIAFPKTPDAAAFDETRDYLFGELDVTRVEKGLPTQIVYKGYGAYLSAEGTPVRFVGYSLVYDGKVEESDMSRTPKTLSVNDETHLVADFRFGTKEPLQYQLRNEVIIPFKGTSAFEDLQRRSLEVIAQSSAHTTRVLVMTVLFATGTLGVGYTIYRIRQAK